MFGRSCRVYYLDVGHAYNTERQRRWCCFRRDFAWEGAGDSCRSARFHVWRMDWDERNIQFFTDDEPLCQIDLDRTYNQDQSHGNPLRQPHYLLLSLAVGGTI